MKNILYVLCGYILLFIIIGFIISFLTGCAGTQIKPDYHTKLGIRIVTNGYQINPDIIDHKYLDMLECYGISDISKYLKKFDVFIIKNPKDDPRGFQYWICRPDTQPDLKCTGQYNAYGEPPQIKVPPDLRALAHEFGHFLAHQEIDWWMQYAEGECAISHICGDKIDRYWNTGVLNQNWKPTPSKTPCEPFYKGDNNNALEKTSTKE